MAGTAVQLISGTAEQTATYTGAAGSLSYESDTNILKLHNGQQAGGFVVPTLVAVQRPTAANDYTWYRKYASGWVEQGGRCLTTIEKPLPITMADSNYTLLALPTRYNANQGTIGLEIMMQDADKFQIGYRWNGTYVQISIPWFVAGYAA